MSLAWRSTFSLRAETALTRLAAKIMQSAPPTGLMICNGQRKGADLLLAASGRRMGSGAVGELHTRRVDRRSNGECLGRSCLAFDQELDAKLPILFAAGRGEGTSMPLG